MGLYQTLQIAFQIPDASNVVGGTRQEVLPTVAPLNRGDVVVLVLPLRFLHIVLHHQRVDVPQLCHRQLVLGRRGRCDHVAGESFFGLELAEVPNVDIVVSAASGGEQLLILIPFD